MNKEPTTSFFERCFGSLTGNPPFHWQKRLFERFVDGNLPACVNVPTGCGKTAIMEIWVLALAYQALTGAPTIPRRLVWIVNRRTVVDQATEEAERIAKQVINPPCDDLKKLKQALSKLCVLKDRPICVSTLRGEYADNGEWKRDPTRPSIIVGTVDMIGSKLVFSGYGDGKWQRPFHAALLAVDALIVFDEAHLVPPFQRLLEEVYELNTNPLKPFGVIHSTATHRKEIRREKIGEPFKLGFEDRAGQRLKKRLEAQKVLRLNYVSDSKKIMEKIVELAADAVGKVKRIIVYVESPETVVQIEKSLRKRLEKDKKEAQIFTLTGTIRGYERERQLDQWLPYFKPDSRDPEKPLYLISTSAGEVGVDLDAEYCVCDLAPIERLIQRFGRINRLGRYSSFIDLVYGNDREWREPVLKYLQGLPKNEGGYDVSPITLSNSPPPADAFGEEPVAPQLTRSLVERWSLTTIGRAELFPVWQLDLWLHGEKEEPETHVVWREEVRWIASEEKEDLREILQLYPIRTREKLRDRTWKIKKKLNELLKTRKAKVPGFDGIPIIIILAGGETKGTTLTDESMVENLKLENATVILPTEIGGLTKETGMFEPGSEEPVKDVADENETRARFYITLTDDRCLIKQLAAQKEFTLPITNWRKELESKIKEIDPNLEIVKKLRISESDEGTEVVYLLYAIRKEDVFEAQCPTTSRQGLEEHCRRVEELVGEIGQKLNLPPNLLASLKHAGRWHDKGKDRKWWQEALGNPDPTRPLAKSSEKEFNWRAICGYRHEFGSLRDYESQGADALTAHLISATHGYARPGFVLNPSDPELEGRKEECKETNLRAIQRFAQLQQEYGWWNLAYLEALLKAADAMASIEGVR